jgi:lathosterol oxidase
MLSHLLGLPESVLVSWLTLTLAGVTIYFTLSGLSYLVVYILARRRFHPSYVANPASNRRAMRLSVISTLGNITLLMPFHALIGSGHSRVYWAVSERGLPWLLSSIVLYVAFVDTVIYWSHRTLHNDFFYRHLHRYHHEWQIPNSWTSMAFHPVDAFVFALPVQLFAFIVPLNGYVYLAMQSLMSLWSVSSHDRVALVRWRWFNYADNHTLHHWFYRCNYGQFFTFWDRIMGTWRNPVEEARTGRVPQDVLR